MDKTTRTKLLFWLILGSFSVFFAEVVSGSSMFPYFTLWGVMAVMPLYTLHILVLSYIVFSRGRPDFHTLFIAGAIFGMYEAYITKVLWDPPWGPPIIQAGGIAAVEMLVLVLWWHPIMSFIIPLFTAERLLTGSKEVASIIPARIRGLSNSNRWLLLAISGGLFQGAGSPSPAHSLLSGLSATGFLFFLVYLWKTRTNGNGYTLVQLLPSRREFQVLFSLLIALYITTGIFLRPEALPGFFPQLIIWLIYAGLFSLLYLNLKSSSKIPLSETADVSIRPSWKNCLVLSLVFAGVSAVTSASHAGMFIMAVMWIAGSIAGTYLLFRSIRSSFSKSKGS